LGRSSNSCILNNQVGFSLLEVIMAITILAFISLATFKLVDTNTETKTTVVKEDRQIVQTITAVGRLESDISQLYTPLFAYSKMAPTANNSNNIYADTPVANGSFDGKTKDGNLIPQIKAEDKSSLIFLTQANRRKMSDSKESRFAWIKYSIRSMEPDPENPDEKTAGLYELIRQSISSDIYNPTLEWDKQKPQVLLERIKSLEFSYWDERAKKYTTSLQELNENKNVIRSVKIDITWIDDNNNEQKLSKALRVLAPYFNTKKDDLQSTPLGATLPNADGTVDSDNSGAGGSNVPQF
jgi:prepilin-type N-terminal cleavage/methylation domain-containing protein